ncbi:UbiA prenyltransferase family protein [Ferruginibacter sp.]
MRLLYFLLSHSIFIAICAVSLCFQTALLLHINLPVYLFAFIFFSTLCSYNFYWLLSGYAFAGQSLIQVLKQYYTNVIVLVLACGGLLFSLVRIPQLLPVIIIGLILTLLYTIPLLPFKIFHLARKAGLVKTFLLAFTWTFVTVYIPYYFAPTVQFSTLLMLFINRFLFMLMLCIIFDARDTNIDKIRGLQSLTTILKPTTVKYIMIAIFAAYIINGIVLRIYYNEPEQIIALLLTGLITAIVYFFSQKKQGYFFYYFLVDGLMLFSALATYVASIAPIP